MRGRRALTPEDSTRAGTTLTVNPGTDQVGQDGEFDLEQKSDGYVR